MGRSVPELCRRNVGEMSLSLDDRLFARAGILVAFSERTGGASTPPFDSLNLGSHVGDDPTSVDLNRSALLEAVELADLADRLVTAEQVHGDRVLRVTETDAGRGAHAGSGAPPIPATDGLVTTQTDLPLLMLFADCVPVVLVATGSVRTVGVAHAGWRGALGRVSSALAREVSAISGAAPSELLGYIGPHIGSCCYNVDATLISQFRNTFGTITAVDGRLDLGAAVRADLIDAGLRPDAIASLDTCTHDHTERYFSYRARQQTGRHGALVAITKGLTDDTSAPAPAGAGDS